MTAQHHPETQSNHEIDATVLRLAGLPQNRTILLKAKGSHMVPGQKSGPHACCESQLHLALRSVCLT